LGLALLFWGIGAIGEVETIGTIATIGVIETIVIIYKSSPHDMETINMWADLSSNVLDARLKRPLSTTSESVVISRDNVAKL
jgi:hypothetical protein